MRARRAPRALAVLLAIVALFAACGGDSMPDAVDRRGQSERARETEAAGGSPSSAAVEQAQHQAQREAQQQAQGGRAEQSDEPRARRAAEDGARQEAEGDAAQGQSAGAARGRPAGTALAPEPIDADYAMEMLRAIAEGIGGRFNGQPGERATIEFMAEALRGDGYQVAIEPFQFVTLDENHWINIASGADGAGETVSLPAFLMEGSPDVPALGPLVSVPGIGTAEDFASVNAEGAVAVVARGELTFSEKQRNAEEAGAVALLIVNLGGAAFVGRLSEPGEIPVFAVPDQFVEHLRPGGDATATIQQPVAGEFLESWNVVARRAGGVCRVVVGGHYDSVPNVQGANDNASGIAVTLALARAWAGAASAADVCFVGFGAEELGLHGSQAFVEAARESGELAETTAMLNLDAFGNGERPIIGVGSDELTELFERLGEQLGIEVESGEGNPGQGSDHAAFYQAGVPVLFPITRGGILHVPADNMDNIDATLVRDVGLLAQAMLECLLERAGSRIEPRPSCDA